MELEHSFTVPVPVDEAWTVLTDVERVAPCMPGAALKEFDGERFTGSVRVKLGPVNLTYAGTGRFVSRDPEAHRVVIEASGRDRTASTAAATVTATLHADNGGTRVDMVTDLRITGAPAQFGRGMIGDVSGRLLDQFADRLRGELGAAAEPAAEPAPSTVDEPAAEPEPIDLLKVTGLADTARRVAPVALGLLAGLALIWVLVRWLSRR
jgi:carbon monoxide dehydrogenase subunit G